MKARRLPLLVDAFPWTPPEGYEGADAFAVSLHETEGLDIRVYPNGDVELRTQDRKVMELHHGDHIIRRTHDDGTTCVYVISDEAFKRGYRIERKDQFTVIACGPGLNNAGAGAVPPCGIDDAIDCLRAECHRQLNIPS